MKHDATAYRMVATVLVNKLNEVLSDVMGEAGYAPLKSTICCLQEDKETHAGALVEVFLRVPDEAVEAYLAAEEAASNEQKAEADETEGGGPSDEDSGSPE